MRSPLKNALLGATALLLIGAGNARAQVGTTVEYRHRGPDRYEELLP